MFSWYISFFQFKWNACELLANCSCRLLNAFFNFWLKLGETIACLSQPGLKNVCWSVRDAWLLVVQSSSQPLFVWSRNAPLRSVAWRSNWDDCVLIKLYLLLEPRLPAEWVKDPLWDALPSQLHQQVPSYSALYSRGLPQVSHKTQLNRI